MCKREPEVALFILSTRLSLPPPPSFLWLPHATRSRGGTFHRFHMTLATAASLAFECDPEVALFTVSTRLLPPPLLHPNTTWRWLFSLFLHDSHHYCLRRVQTRAGGGLFHSLHTTSTTTTSLMSKRKLEYHTTLATAASLASKCELEVALFIVLTRLLPPLPPSYPNPSWKWPFSFFRCDSDHQRCFFLLLLHNSHHRLSRIQM
jgi:hypothetical protein